MSLVDYASSSDDDVSDSEQEPPKQRYEAPPAPQPSPPRPPSPPKTLASGSSSTLEKLPDASVLLNSPTVSLRSSNDHASVVAAAMAESASRKRDSKGLSCSGSVAPPLPKAKLPRATLPHSKSVPDTGGGILVPPQLKGRSNVVTEDISKLFVSRHAVAQPRPPEN
ncbi:hypothetical protein PTKIN_Ptkin01aG0148300 [Pterospermum kingtungense]